MRQEINILRRLHRRDRKALLAAAGDHAENMVILAFTILQDADEANVLVRDVLLSLWEQGFLGASPPLHRYLYDQVRRACEMVPFKTSD